MIATEFIDDGEIQDTLRYARENKDNLSLVNSLLDKARERKGLTHREAAVLLLCEDKDAQERMFTLAAEIKQEFYGNRIVMFAPLYLSNYCVNGCIYCPYHAKNHHIPRKQLSQEEIRREVIALQDWATSGWLWKPGRIRSTAPLSTCWKASKPSTPSSIRTAPSAGSM